MVENRDVVELQADSVVFYSRHDEANFFAWLQQLPCVVDVAGKGRVIHVQVERGRVDDEALGELLALFHRYQVDLRQLRVFDERRFARWFRRRQGWWYPAVFGQPGCTGAVE
ncbi:hypothetical protein [Stenotrophomonas sp.]|uniref:hypothetical protein n=1 Tax=Stenotrophomonas sp. TaxID=69392 RepID=UPI002D56520E|nr:hypothetical protein [Stenotrophomonas sp.]HYQ23097.1 hypothetical protein [Stenotrophomonas sp.]